MGGGFMTDVPPRTWDVLVVGGGNAGLCAAMTARRAGSDVLLLEAAPRAFRGGNSRHTRGICFQHARATPYHAGTYPEDRFWEDLLRVTRGRTNGELARLTIRESANLPEWMAAHGIRWERLPRLTPQVVQILGPCAVFLGGGKALVNAYYETAQQLGVVVRYDSEVRELEIHDHRFVSAVVEGPGEPREVHAKAVVLASGGFEANVAWLKETWGQAAENFVIRGTHYNQGRMLRQLFDHGAKPAGTPHEFHAIAVDARGPRFDGGIVTRLDSIPFGIVVNREARRFYDEGEDLWFKRYALWGGLIARQPDQIAFSILDRKGMDGCRPSVFPAIQAHSIHGLAVELGLDATDLQVTIAEFNRAVRPGSYRRSRLDDCRTEGLDPPKSHWALALDTPPFYGYPLRSGITFTYFGVAVDARARVILQDDQPALNIFAAGEIMAGNILGHGYIGGLGLTIGTVFGRIAGREAATLASA
jgi:tricarballylate dehydrogenase